MYSSNDSWQLDRWLTRSWADEPEAPRCPRCDDYTHIKGEVCLHCEEVEAEAAQDRELQSEAGNSTRHFNE